MKHFNVLLFLIGVGISYTYGQEVLTGKVVAMADGVPLVGVTVSVDESSISTKTDDQGFFKLTVDQRATHLLFRMLGYSTARVSVEGRTQIDVRLIEEGTELDEVVVVGYGTQQKANITGSIVSVKGAEVAKQPLMQVSQALMGKMPGVTAIQKSSQPGNDAATIRIRGIGTLSNSDPLVLIDGVPGNMNNVDPRDVEDIAVLKDAASAAIYGSRAANGVVLITTKRGSVDRFTVNLNTYIGFQSPTEQPEFLGGYEFMTLHNMARENVGQTPLYSRDYIDSWVQGHVTDPDQYPNTDWTDLMFTENGFQQHHSLSISGGSEMARIMASLSYMDQGGNVANFDYDRYNARINTDLKASDKLSFNFDVNFLRSIRDQPSGGLALIRDGYRTPPIYAARTTTGAWAAGRDGGNVVARIYDGGNMEAQYNYLRAVFKTTYKPVKGMQLSLMYAPQYQETHSATFTKKHKYFEYGNPDPVQTGGQTKLQQSNDRDLTHLLNALASYETSFGDHFLKGLVGYELNTFRRDWGSASRDNFPLIDYPFLNAGSPENMQNTGTAEEWGLQSVFARVNYDYKGRYLLEGNIRLDGSSRFSAGNKYGMFPAFSAGWRVSEEPFFENTGLINELKIRASWGQLGNQNIGTYPYASVIQLGEDYLLGGVPNIGAAQTNMANGGISWETTETTNVGIDLSMLRNRLSVSAEYYIRNTFDILLQVPVPMTIGLEYPYQNAGKVKNKGWDLSLNWNDRAGNLEYGVGFNLSDVHNKVTDLYGTGPYISGSQIIAEGYPINSLYGYQSAGLFQSQEEVDNAPTHIGTIAPGDIRYVDQNGDNVINADDRTVIGDPFPRYSYGLNLMAGFKGLDLSAMLQGVGKRDIFLQQDMVWAFYNAGSIQRWHLDYWSSENPNASYPRLVATTSHNNFQATDYWTWSSAFMRVRNVTLGYSLPKSVLAPLSIDQLRFYVSGQNLFTADKMPKGWDPEMPTGAVGEVYPVTAVYTFGINLTF